MPRWDAMLWGRVDVRETVRGRSLFLFESLIYFLYVSLPYSVLAILFF